MVESLLLATTEIATYDGNRPLTRASGFFFERDARLFLVTSRHVVIDAPSAHNPDRIEFSVHTDPADLARTITLSALLFRNGLSCWRQAGDGGGEIDVAAIEIDRSVLGANAAIVPFGLVHLESKLDSVEVGQQLLIPCYPLGFQDTVYRLPVVRQATVASSFGIRFQGQGFFLTDGRTHRGSSGAPVVMRAPDLAGAGPLRWKLLGVHSARMDVGGRDRAVDEALGLNCAWYADVLRTLTET